MVRVGVKKKLSRRKSHRKALQKNQLRSVFTYGYITTTTPKAKVLKSEIERFLEGGKKENLEFSRYMHTVLGKKDLVENARKYIKEGDGNVKILRIGFRDGDAAETSKVMLSGYENVFGENKPKSKQGKKETKKESKTEKRESSVEKEPEKIVEKDENKEKADKGFMNKVNTDLKGQFTKKEKARSRSGL